MAEMSGYNKHNMCSRHIFARARDCFLFAVAEIFRIRPSYPTEIGRDKFNLVLHALSNFVQRARAANVLLTESPEFFKL